MVFSSVIFLFYFFPITLILYFLIRNIKYRNLVLLAASLFFYAFGEPLYILIMMASIVINYVSGIFLDKEQNSGMRKLILVFSVILNIGILFYFKYIDFFIDMINRITGTFNGNHHITQLNIALPIGLSFFTFQGLSYVIDVYRKDVSSQKNLLKLALYISMFPQLVAGPIVRYRNVMDEIDNRTISLEVLKKGISRFIIGLSKKVMIADILAVSADKAFLMGGQQLKPATAWLGAVCYMLQIYFDFSGYSDMAIGIGHILGFTFPENFDQPYTSRSISEFWRKWHITLSGWFRDYLYIPLGGNRRGNVYFNLLIVFICTGLWHGADYTFVFWGLWHGMFIILERIAKNRGISIKVPDFLKRIYTILVVLIGWVFFRAPTLGSGIRYLRSMFGVQRLDDFLNYNIWYFMDYQTLFILFAAIFICTGIPAFLIKKTGFGKTKLNVVYYCCLLAMFMLSGSMVINGNFSPFIYFRF